MMAKKFIIKKVVNNKKNGRLQMPKSDISKTDDIENKSKKNSKVMNTKEKIEMAKEALNQVDKQKSFKKIKNDKGLIERTESSVTILTEDNRELLKD